MKTTLLSLNMFEVLILYLSIVLLVFFMVKLIKNDSDGNTKK